MRNQKLYVSLAGSNYDSGTKTFEVTPSELINFNLEGPYELVFDKITLSFEEKLQWVYVCSEEIAVRRKQNPFLQSGMGNTVSVIHTPLAHYEVSDTTSTTTTEDAVTSATIAARSDLFMFLDFADSYQVTVDEEQLTQIIATNSSTFTFVSSDVAGIPYENFGTESAKCINLNAGNIRLSDSSTAAEPESGALIMLFSTQTTIDDQQILTDWYRWRIYCNSDKLAYYDGSTNDVAISLLAATDYLLTVRRNATEFIWRLEKLSDNTTQEITSSNGGSSSGTGLFDVGGTGSDTADGRISNLVVLTSNADADVEEVELYMRQQYRGVGSTTTTTTVTTYNYSAPTAFLNHLRKAAARKASAPSAMTFAGIDRAMSAKFSQNPCERLTYQPVFIGTISSVGTLISSAPYFPPLQEATYFRCPPTSDLRSILVISKLLSRYSMCLPILGCCMNSVNSS